MSPTPSNTIPITQPEQVLENELVAQLVGQELHASGGDG